MSEFLRRYHLLFAIGLGLAISGLSFFWRRGSWLLGNGIDRRNDCSIRSL